MTLAGSPLGRAAAASLTLHAAALAAMLLFLNRPKQPAPAAEQSVEVVWQEQTGTTEGEPAPPAAPAAPEPVPPPPPPPAIPPPSLAPPPPPLAALLPPPTAPGAVILPPPPPEAPPASEAPPAPPQPQPQPQLQAEAEAEPETEPLPIPPPEPAPPPPPQPRARPTPARPAPAAAPASPAGPVSQQPLTTGAAPALGAITPPGLADGIRNPTPDYPLEARQRGEQGVVGLVIRVTPNGTVEDVEVVASSGFPGLDDSAKRAVRRWRFRPAMRDGIPISGNIRTSIHFQLNR